MMAYLMSEKEQKQGYINSSVGLLDKHAVKCLNEDINKIENMIKKYPLSVNKSSWIRTRNKLQYLVTKM